MFAFKGRSFNQRLSVPSVKISWGERGGGACGAKQHRSSTKCCEHRHIGISDQVCEALTCFYHIENVSLEITSASE
jgi:hypothetical protein